MQQISLLRSYSLIHGLNFLFPTPNTEERSFEEDTQIQEGNLYRVKVNCISQCNKLLQILCNTNKYQTELEIIDHIWFCDRKWQNVLFSFSALKWNGECFLLSVYTLRNILNFHLSGILKSRIQKQKQKFRNRKFPSYVQN